MLLRRLFLALALWWAVLALVLAGSERLRFARAADLQDVLGAQKSGPGKDIPAAQHTASPRILPAPLAKRLPRHHSGLLTMAPQASFRAPRIFDEPPIAECAECVRVRRHIPRLNSDEPPWAVGT